MVKARQTISSSDPFEKDGRKFCLLPSLQQKHNTMLSTTHMNTFMSPLTFAMSIATRNSAQTSSYLIPGQHYLETFMLLSYNNQDYTFMGDYIIPVLNQQTQLLLHLLRRIFRSDIQQCLDCSDALTVAMPWL